MCTYPSRRTLVAVFIATAALVLSGCGSSNGPTGAQSSAPAEVQVGEGPAVPYSDTRFHYRIDAPGPMTVNSDGTAAYVGPSQRLEISIVQGSGAADPAALATHDLSALTSSAQAFHKLAGPSAVTINGRTVLRFSYTWNAGISQVTGKPIDLTTVRYYVPKDAGTLAVITYGIVSIQFDPQGADDLVTTFQWQ